MRPIPVLRLPFQMDADGRAATVDQDSDEEIVQGVAVILGTQPGERPMVPGFGLADVAFTRVDVESDVQEAVAAWDDRVDRVHVRAALSARARADVTVEVEL